MIYDIWINTEIYSAYFRYEKSLYCWNALTGQYYGTYNLVKYGINIICIFYGIRKIELNIFSHYSRYFLHRKVIFYKSQNLSRCFKYILHRALIIVSRIYVIWLLKTLSCLSCTKDQFREDLERFVEVIDKHHTCSHSIDI